MILGADRTGFLNTGCCGTRVLRQEVPMYVCMPIAHPITHPDIHLCRDYFSFRGQASFKGNFHYRCQTAVI